VSLWIGDELLQGGRADIETAADLRIWGEGVTAVAGPAGISFLKGEDGAYLPPPSLLDRLRQTSGTIELIVTLGGRETRVTVEHRTRRLQATELAALRAAVGALALSHEQEAALEAPLPLAADEQGSINEVGEVGAASWGVANLFQTLERYLPLLLDQPLSARRLERGRIPVERARLTPQILLARKFQPTQRLTIGQRVRESIPSTDYAWLRSIVSLVAMHAESTARLRTSIRDDPNSERALKDWSRPLRKLRTWLAHPLLSGALDLPPANPSWVLDRSVPGAAIVRAVRLSPLKDQVGGDGWSQCSTSHRLTRLPVANDAHLYELWTFLSVVDVLRNKFGFQWEDEVGRDLRAEARHDRRSGKWSLPTARLVWRGPDPFGLQLELKATIRHEPRVRNRYGGYFTPDLVMWLSGGVPGEERTTCHVLEAKWRSRPHQLAREVARDRYLWGLDPQPCSVFVALPSAGAELARLVSALSASQRRTTAIARTSGEAATHGFAWGCISARPVSIGDEDCGTGARHPGHFGIRQFVTMALQYHRWELRHVCSNCGAALGRHDMD